MLTHQSREYQAGVVVEAAQFGQIEIKAQFRNALGQLLVKRRQVVDGGHRGIIVGKQLTAFDQHIAAAVQGIEPAQLFGNFLTH